MKKDFPKVAVDIVIFTVDNGRLKVILIQMKKKPFTGKWAFPGGLVGLRESLDDAARRELYEKTGVKNVYLEQLYTFGEVRRDPFSRVVSVAYFALVNRKQIKKLITTSKYQRIDWFDVNKLPRLAYDHNEVAKYAIARLRAKLEYTNIAFSLLPRYFTLAALQEAYEIILGRKLDKRNFIKKIDTLHLLRKTQKFEKGAHRPARLYEFRSRKPQIIEIL